MARAMRPREEADPAHGSVRPWNTWEASLKRESPVLKKPREQTRKTAVKAARRSKTPELNEEEERILQKAQLYLLLEARRPHLWTVADIREEKGEDGSRRWIIAVNLRYPTGFEGYLGDLLYDGAKITELTDLGLMRERARQNAADPEGRRQWDELKAAALRAGKPKHVRPGQPANGPGGVRHRRRGKHSGEPGAPGGGRHRDR
jgi:hypothetical protein